MKPRIICIFLAAVCLQAAADDAMPPATTPTPPDPTPAATAEPATGAPPTGPSENLTATSGAALPFDVKEIETSETKEIHNISTQAATLIQAKDFASLDALAARYRASRERNADGHWKLSAVYAGLNLSDDMSDEQCRDRIAILRRWMLSRPMSITPRVALADTLVSYAWRARGYGAADTVTREAAALYDERLRQAADVLNQSKGLTEKCPRFWTVQLWIDLGLNVPRGRFDADFNEAIYATPDYEPYYETRATYLLPRFGGAPGEWEADLARSAARIGAGDGDILYARVVWGVHHFFDTNVMKENRLSWAQVDRGMETIEALYPMSPAPKNEHAYLAVLAGDKPKAQRCFARTQGNADLAVWNSADQFQAFANYAYTAK